jgi:hypothetical protein
MKPLPDRDVPLEARAISQVAVQTIRWLWQNRLAFGKLAMLDGDPDKGKSLVTLDLCARLTTGRAFPDGCPGPGPANVIVLNAEDGAGDTIRPRLQALGADLDRVFILQRGEHASGAVLGLPSDIAVLEAALVRTGAKVVIVDPIVAFLDPAVQLGSDSSVRRALAPLLELAEKYQCVIILVRHLNKSGAHHSMYRGGGSIGFLAAFGFRNPFAAVWGTLDAKGILWLTGEHYSRERCLSDHADYLPRDVSWYGDPAGAGDIAQLCQAGFKVRAGDNTIRLGIAAVRARLEKGTLRILQGACPNLLAEAALYRYGPERGSDQSENPVNEHNHALGALRYLISRLDARLMARLRQPGSEKNLLPDPGAAAVDPLPKARENTWMRWSNPELWTRWF